VFGVTTRILAGWSRVRIPAVAVYYLFPDTSREVMEAHPGSTPMTTEFENGIALLIPTVLLWYTGDTFTF
jgi:hypothetical protein